MDNTAIAIIAHNRPHYLYTLLHSLSLAEGIEGFPVFVFFDRVVSDTIRILQREVLTNFKNLDISGVTFHEERLGVLKGVLTAYRTVFEQDYDRAILFEEDVIVRPDFLWYLEGVLGGAVFYNLTAYELDKPNYLMGRYRAFGNMLDRHNFPNLYDWVSQGKYIGRPTYDGKEFLDERWGHDAIFTCYMRDNGEFTQFADKHYVVHVGIGGTHYKLSDELKAFRDELFGGKREVWLYKLIQLVESDYRKDLELVVCPRGFKYK
jgi:hypothetical protein